jgi:hypothetical protein
MSEKRNLILDFASECFFIALFCLAMVAHSEFFLILGLFLSAIYSSSKRFFQKKLKPKKRERELTTVETIAWFSICISAICILGFFGSKGLLHHPAFIIPMWIIVFSIRLLYFSKELAALQTSKPASN